VSSAYRYLSILQITTVTNELNINLENQFIKNVNTKKLLGIYILGIYIDNNLDWKEQVDHMCKNINSRLFLLSKIKIYLDKKSRILFFFNIYLTNHSLAQLESNDMFKCTLRSTSSVFYVVFASFGN
jgi:hypothetical protein